MQCIGTLINSLPIPHQNVPPILRLLDFNTLIQILRITPIHRQQCCPGPKQQGNPTSEAPGPHPEYLEYMGYFG